MSTVTESLSLELGGVVFDALLAAVAAGGEPASVLARHTAHQ
ncbi:hypothetical protein ABLO01_08925 [Mycobacterium tuberculosis]